MGCCPLSGTAGPVPTCRGKDGWSRRKDSGDFFAGDRILWAARIVFAEGGLVPIGWKHHECTADRTGSRPAVRRLAAEAAPLLRPHDRIGDRWRGRGAGGTDESRRGAAAGWLYHLSGSLAVPDRP